MKSISASPFLADGIPLSAREKEMIDRLWKEEYEREWSPPATDEPLCPKRLNRVSHTITEIQAQPDKVAETVREERAAIQEAAGFLSRREINHIYMTGCGDSVAALGGARYLLEDILGIPCEDVQALDFAYYNHACVDEKSLVILLSSSGATLRTLEAMYIARQKGAQTLALSNTPDSVLMRESTRGLTIHATRKGWPTQASTAAMALTMQLGVQLARARNSCDAGRLDEIQKEFDSIPELMRRITSETDAKARELAVLWSDRGCYLFTAGGPSYSSAFFGAAKIKEATVEHALCIPLEEFHHYNSIKKDEPVFVISPAGFSVPRARDTLVEARHWGGVSCVVTTQGEEALAELADHAILLPPVSEYFSGLCTCIPVQLFGYYSAMEKFRKAGLPGSF